MKKRYPRLTLLAALIWLAGIWTASSIPAEDMPSIKVISIDKLAHVGVYFVLALLVNRSLLNYRVKRNYALMVYLLLLISAGMDEYHQYFIPGRSVSIYDFIANGIGLLGGLLLFVRQHDRSH
ncbi:MAG: VanZ family protein [Candidatus Cloacimonadaceae bacterium]|nr:VanZ family protein [Candidatus Cloacimonadaceae bacterium]